MERDRGSYMLKKETLDSGKEEHQISLKYSRTPTVNPVTPTRNFTPGKRKMIKEKVKKPAAEGAIQESINQLESTCYTE